MAEQPFAITISHQLCSGGSYLGQKLSEALDVPFINREILKLVAEKLNLAEAVLEQREEHLSGLWDSLSRIAIYTNPAECLSSESYIPTDRELFDLESNVIARIAERRSAIFLGRCGRAILRDHPRRFSLLVVAEMPERIQRAQELYDVDAAEARKLLDNNDRERKEYIRAFTHQDAWDARLYDLCLNLSTVGKEASAQMALLAAREKLQIKETLE